MTPGLDTVAVGLTVIEFLSAEEGGRYIVLYAVKTPAAMMAMGMPMNI